MIPDPLNQLVKHLSKLPGLGPRSAQKAALHMLTSGDSLQQLQLIMKEVGEKVVTCSNCGNIGLDNPCHICTNETRDENILCIVEEVDDLWALERSGAFKGYYHVLGGIVSAIDGIGLEELLFNQLVKRLEKEKFSEVILALGASVDGQTTSHLISREIKSLYPNITISTLAKGMPMGANVDYMDEGTLSLALQGRQSF
jgi:recombination protein RecR